MHLFTYSWNTYAGDHCAGGTLSWRAFADAYNPVDLVRVFVNGLQWVVKGTKEGEHADGKRNRESDEREVKGGEGS